MLSHCGLPLTLLLLLLLANGAPVVLGLLIGAVARPVDGGRVWLDGRPVFGRSKTWRGLVAALVLTPIAAWLLGCGWSLGLTIASAAMAGDLLASFTKRRLGLVSSTSVPVLDQVPETLLPAVLVAEAMGLDWIDLGLVIGAFVVLDLVLTPVGKRLAGRRRG